MKTNAEELRKKMEKDQDIANHNTAFISAVIALAALSSFFVKPFLEHVFSSEQDHKSPPSVVSHHSVTNSSDTKATSDRVHD